MFFVTRFLDVSSLLLVGIIGMVVSFAIVACTYFAWGRDTLVRHRQTRRELIFTAPGVYLLGLFLSFVELIDEKKYDFWD